MTGERDALDKRPDPDELLARYRRDEPGPRGRLRLYVGMAPGVGKTYRMLEEGHRRVGRGTDVVVGYVEAHGRPLTEALVGGLEVVPRRRLEHRGMVVEEMDADAVVARRPTVALIDELAHTNAPGSPHGKRWEEVEEIRAAGIHVVSTMNVQHLESLADAVATITGAPVHERLPDEVLLDADEIELVDMAPHALRQRMRHGNVYPPERATIALDRFFTEANLTALRELSLRVVARRVEGDLEGVGQGTLPLVTDRVAVYLDGGRAGPTAVRRAAALASRLHAELIAVVPAAAVTEALSFDEGRDLRDALDAAIDLGADVLPLAHGDVADELAATARRTSATHVFIPAKRTSLANRVVATPLADRLGERLRDVDIHIVWEPK